MRVNPTEAKVLLSKKQFLSMLYICSFIQDRASFYNEHVAQLCRHQIPKSLYQKTLVQILCLNYM